jgi:predicted trehalose synthase
MPNQPHSGELHTNEELARRIETALGGFRDVLKNMETTIMAAIDDLNAKIDEVAGKIETVGTDLATEIAALAAANNNPATGTPDAAIAASIAKLQVVSDRLSAIAASMPLPPTP